MRTLGTTGGACTAKARIGAGFLLVFLLSAVHAQELTSVQVNRAEVSIGESVDLLVRLKMVDNSKQTVCNLVVDFGDGRTEQIRVTSPQLTFSIQHTYQQPGPAVIQVTGKTRFQGLQSAIGCFGANRTVAVNVLPEDFAARRAAAIAEKEAALKRAEADRREAELAAADAQRQRQEAQLAVQKARNEKATAKAARDRAAAAAKREQVVANPKPAAVTPGAAPIPKPAPDETPKPKNNQPKPKSSLDL